MNKKRYLISILILSSLFSCSNKVAPDSSLSSQEEKSSASVIESNEKSSSDVSSAHNEDQSSDNTSFTEASSSSEIVSSSEVVSSSEINSSSNEMPSSQEEDSIVSLNEAVSQSLSLTNEVNEAGYYKSEEIVEFEGKVLTIADSICTKKYYNESNRYKALVSDGNDLAYVALTDTMYKSMKDYAGASNSVYRFKAYLGKYYSSAELIAIEATWLNKTLAHDFPYDSLPLLNLSEVQEEISSLPISEKGFCYGKTVRFQATYIDELVQEVLLFSDGTKTIQLHGDSKISNSFSKGSRYEVVANLGLYQYKPSLEFVTIAQRLEGKDELPPSTSKTASDQYKITYQKDKNYHQSKYESDYYSTYEFTGYVNAFAKDGTYTFVLIDQYKESNFSTKETARAGKALFVNNETERNVYGEKELNYSSLYDYYLENKRIKITYSPYLFHTESYWMVFCHFSTLSVVD